MPTDANGYRAPRPQIAEIEPYDPKYLPARIMISANENPRPLPHEVQAKIEAAITQVDLNRYPDPLANPLRKLIGQAWGYDREYVLMGNGGDELLFDFALCWAARGARCSPARLPSRSTRRTPYSLIRKSSPFRVRAIFRSTKKPSSHGLRKAISIMRSSPRRTILQGTSPHPRSSKSSSKRATRLSWLTRHMASSAAKA